MSVRNSIALLIAGGMAMAGCKSSDSAGNSGSGGRSGTAGAKVNPSAVQSRAKSPPPMAATTRVSIGSGPAAMNTANSAGDTDSYWVEDMDLDGDGDVEATSLLWDDEDKVLFAYAETEVPCIYGGTAVAALLIGVNGKDNPRGMPEGSGFYATYLDAMECGAEMSGLFGSKFDANGNVTMSGAAILDQVSDSITIVTVSRGY